jgi:hypothetical protein
MSGSWRAWIAPAAAVVSMACAAPPASIPSLPAAQVQDGAVAAVSLIDPRLRRAWPDDPEGAAWFSPGGYHLFARWPGEFVAIRAPTMGAVDDVVVTGTFRKVGGPPGGGYGLIVRDRRAVGVDQTGQFIVAAVGDRGDLGIWQRDGERWIDLVPWTASPSVRSGGSPNELRVEVMSNGLHFDVNGTRVADVRVPLETGRVGIFVGGDQNEVVADRLIVQPLPSAAHADRSAKERAVACASARLADLSTRARQSTSAPPAEVEAWRRDVSGVLGVVQQLERDLSADYSAPNRESARVARARVLMDEIQTDLADIFDFFRDGFDSPRSPINNAASLATAAARLDHASRTAEQLRSELQAMRAAYSRDVP